MRTAVQIGRLLRLADFLDILDRKRFDFETWVGRGWNGDDIAEPECKTTACALGWATTIPEFRELGLVMQYVPSYNRGISGINGHPRIHNSVTQTTWKDVCFAAETIFGLTAYETEYLFTPRDCSCDPEPCSCDDPRLPRSADPKDVADLIRRFVTDSKWLA